MRTARYVIRIKDDTPSWYRPDARTRNKQFGLFADVCRNLAKDGFTYSVDISRQDAYLTLTVTGTADRGKVTRNLNRVRKPWPIPAKLTTERCVKYAALGQKRIDSDQHYHERALKFDSPAWRAFDGVLHSAVSAGDLGDADSVARLRLAAAWCDVADPDVSNNASVLRAILHRSLNYVLWELHYVADSPYRAISGLCNPGDYSQYGSPNIDCARKWYARDTASHDASKSAARDFMAQLSELRQAETDHWKEMEMLSGQRDHFRPGVADTLDSNDELGEAA